MTSSLYQGLVLLVSEPLRTGGIAVYTSTLMGALTSHRVPHAVITPEAPAQGVLSASEAARVQVVSGLFWSFWHPFNFRRLLRWARENEVTLIHGLSAYTMPVCARLAEALQLPYIISVHHFQDRGGLRYEKNCRGVIALSQSLRENLVNDVHIPKELVRVIPAGIRVSDSTPARDSSTDGESTLPLIASIGKLVERKDFATFLQAARRVTDALGSECSFIISGDGPEETRLRRLARHLSLDKQVTFCHGHTAHEQLLRDTDVYVQCSHTEGFGTNVLQAMAQAVPVVATSTGGILSLVREGESGFLVPIGKPDVLADRILRLLKDPALRASMGEAARKTALEDFNLDNMMKKTLGFYEEALATHATRVG